jgi:hypothetical protein
MSADLGAGEHWNAPGMLDSTCVWCGQRVAWFNRLRYVSRELGEAHDVCRFCAHTEACASYLKSFGYVRL